MTDTIKTIIRFGRLLEARGLIASSHSGNISIRSGNYMYIKRSGAMLGALKDKDIVKVSLTDNTDPNYKIASVEVHAHKSIYVNTRAKAVIHVHTTYAIVASMLENTLTPIDEEGKFYVANIPIIKAKHTIASKEVAAQLGVILQKHPAAIVKGHGTFSKGENLEEAYKWITIVESIAKIRVLYNISKHLTT